MHLEDPNTGAAVQTPQITEVGGGIAGGKQPAVDILGERYGSGASSPVGHTLRQLPQQHHRILERELKHQRGRNHRELWRNWG